MKTYIKTGMCITLASLMVSADPGFESSTPPSMADHLHLQRSRDPVDGGWLPNLTGLPNKEQVAAITQHINDVMNQETEPRCQAINQNLRLMIFQHFAIYQHMANSQHIYFTDKTAHQWAHVLGMILKESSGDTANITDMKGHSITTNKPLTDLDHWIQILHLSVKTPVKLNYQTNFGLTQTSADRLLVAFTLAKDQKYNTEFLEGREGAQTPRKINLNTAIAIRRLIWFYQDFAQGRLTQEDTRIHKRDINKPEFSERYQTGIKMALLYCGTAFMFREGTQEMTKLEEAMASVAYCKLGNSHEGYGINELDDKCFAQWATICPALNIDIATLTPLSYFQTRNEKPVCESTFTRLLSNIPDS